jgi:D-beta-D-heptose 7-phosphate kinase/D-beta-D-heptose 1-phosphate adenosyltransferase
VGHSTYLAQAKNICNKLVIGLNSDRSVRRLKGENRPINAEQDRAFLLASLLFVDAVVIFEEDTPYNLIAELLPDVLVKGADYKIEDIVGADIVIKNGGKVELIPLVDGFSTSNTLLKI